MKQKTGCKGLFILNWTNECTWSWRRKQASSSVDSYVLCCAVHLYPEAASLHALLWSHFCVTIIHKNPWWEVTFSLLQRLDSNTWTWSKKREIIWQSLCSLRYTFCCLNTLFFFNNFDFLSQINSQAVKWAYDSGTSQHNPGIFSWMQLQS